MNTWRFGRAILLASLLAIFLSLPVAANVREITLDEAIALAEEQNAQVRQAAYDLEEARLALEEVRSTALMQPSPIARFQAESNLAISERNLAMAKNAVRLEVAESFLGVLRLENLMDVVREALQLTERQLRIAEDRYQVGAAAEIEIVRAANQLRMTEANLKQMEGSREIALMAFRMGLGLGLTDPVVPVGHTPELSLLDLDLEADVAFALANRLEILRTEQGVELTRQQVELSDNDYTPAIALARAKLGHQRALDGLTQAKQGIEIEVRQAYTALADHRRQLEVLEAKIGEARQTLEIAEQMYRAGVGTDVEVLGAHVQLTEAQVDYVNTLFDLQIGQVRYLHATARAVTGSEGVANP